MRKRRRRAEIRVPIASMGDIAFLLIIFFMVASHLARERHDLALPRSLDVEELKQTQVTVAIDAKGNLYLQGRPMARADDLEEGVRALLEHRTTDLERTVLFSCDRAVKKSVFEPVLEAIAKAGGLVAALGEMNEPNAPDRPQ